MTNNYNFSAGPAVLPKKVLEQAQQEFLNFQNSQMSVLELSHRSTLFQEIITEAEDNLRELMAIPENYHVLFLQGGASLQFTMVPLNLAANQQAGYINTGNWSEKALSECAKIPGSQPLELLSSKDKNHTYIPDFSDFEIDQSLAYCHITTNNTLEGTSFYQLPETGNVPLVADMSSNILAVDYPVSDFGLIYAGAQKNLGPAGVTVVIVKKELIGHSPVLSSMLDYQIQADNHSLYNTPPTFGIYLANLVFKWVKEQGGVAALEKSNRQKSQLLYDYIDQSTFYHNPVTKKDRSLTNIPFMTRSEKLDGLFVREAEKAGLLNLKGHRLVGGMRASLYNAFPVAGVTALINFMKNFELTHTGGQSPNDF